MESKNWLSNLFFTFFSFFPPSFFFFFFEVREQIRLKTRKNVMLDFCGYDKDLYEKVQKQKSFIWPCK